MKYSILLQLKSAKKSDSKLAKIKLLYPGDFEHSLYGEFKVEEKHLQQAVDNFNAKNGTRLNNLGSPMLPGNYQHASYSEDPENAKACGWIKRLMVENGELWGEIEWTAKAREYIEAKEFQFISPEFDFNFVDENGNDCGFTMLGFALTNVNFLKKNQMPVTLTDFKLNDLEKYIKTEYQREEMAWAFEGVAWAFSSYLIAQIRAGRVETGETLTKEIEKTYKEFLEILKNKLEQLTENGELQMNEELKKLLKLTDGSDGVQEVKNLMDSVKTLTDQVKTLETEKKELSDKVTGYETQLSDSQKEAVKLADRVNKLEESIKLTDAENFIDSQIYDKNTNSGKILPAQRETWLKSYLVNPEQTKELIAGLPVAIHGGEIGSNQPGPENQKKTPDVVLNEKTVELMQDKTNLTYERAFEIVRQQNPELVEAYKNDKRKNV